MEALALEEYRFPTTPSIGSASTTVPTVQTSNSSLYPQESTQNMTTCRICLSMERQCCELLPLDLRNAILALRDRNYQHLKADGMYNNRGRSRRPGGRQNYLQERWNRLQTQGPVAQVPPHAGKTSTPSEHEKSRWSAEGSDIPQMTKARPGRPLR